MKISVIGGGIFGCTAAIFLAREGHKVTLYEEKDDILRGASGHNQFRLHAGYHYPRSTLTIRECMETRASFMTEYGSALLYAGKHLYGIAKNSRTTADEYVSTLADVGLPFGIAKIPEGTVDPEYVPHVYAAAEHWIDIEMLRKIVWVSLREAGVDVKVNTKASAKARHDYDRTVVATYERINETADILPSYSGNVKTELQFEIVEKPVIWLEDGCMRGIGIVVMDGPFACVDPYGAREAHLFSHVELSIHRRFVGETFDIPYFLKKDINAGVVSPVRHSRFDMMRDDAAFYLPFMRKALHIGSFYTVRAVRPDVDATDERLTDVRYIDKDQGIIRIFSGKIGSCVEAAKQVVELL